MTEFQVRKDNFAEYRVVESDAGEAIVDGQVNLAVERFGFTSNNITYAAVGHKLGYWQFFPALGADAGALPARSHWSCGCTRLARPRPGAQAYTGQNSLRG